MKGNYLIFDEHKELDLGIPSRLNLADSINISMPDTSLVADKEPHNSIAGIKAKETLASDFKRTPVPTIASPTGLTPPIRLPQISSAAQSTSNPQSSRDDSSASPRRTLMDSGTEVSRSSDSTVPPLANFNTQSRNHICRKSGGVTLRRASA